MNKDYSRGRMMFTTGSEDKLRNRLSWFLVHAALRISTPGFRQMFDGALIYGQNASRRDTLQHRPLPSDWQDKDAHERYRAGED